MMKRTMRRALFIFALLTIFATPTKMLASEEGEEQPSLLSYYIGALRKASIPEPLIQLYNMYKNAIPEIYNDFSRWYASLKYRFTKKPVSLDDRLVEAAQQLLKRYDTAFSQRSRQSLKSAIDLFKLIVKGEPENDFKGYITTHQLTQEIMKWTTEQRIEFYFKRIFDKMALAGLSFSPGKEMDFKRGLLQMIKDELPKKESYDPAINSLLQKWNKEEAQSFAPEKSIQKSDKTITFADYIGVPEEARNFVNQINHPEIYEKFGSPVPNGILLTGAAGTGKTYLARAIAGELDCPFFSYEATDFTGRIYVGTAAQAINDAFSTARKEAEKEGKKIAIMFIDEFDALGSRSAASGEQTAHITEIINTFLPQLDGFEQKEVKVIIIGATNHPENIDPALKRPGRIDTIIHITYPDKESRKELLKQAFEKTFINNNIQNTQFLDKLADATEGLSQVSVKTLVENAGRIAIQQKKGDTGIDRDCLARALWNMKKTKYIEALSTRSQREQFLKKLIELLSLKAPLNDLLTKTENMTLIDIEEVFIKTNNRAQTQPDKSMLEWLWIALEAQNQLIKIKQNRDLIHLCEKLYDPIKIKGLSDFPYKIADFSPEQMKTLLNIQPEDIFKKFAESKPVHAMLVAKEALQTSEESAISMEQQLEEQMSKIP